MLTRMIIRMFSQSLNAEIPIMFLSTLGPTRRKTLGKPGTITIGGRTDIIRDGNQRCYMFDALQLIGGLILAVGYIPQIVQLIRTKSCKDLNLKTYVTVFIGVALMEAYAINMAANGSGLMFLITNSMALTINGVLCGLIIKYKKRSAK